MPFKISPVDLLSDLPQLGSVIFGAHQGQNPFVNATHPDNLTEEGQERGMKRLCSTAESAGEPRWEKVVDTETGEVSGVAIW
jgi:hypothetical protein